MFSTQYIQPHVGLPPEVLHFVIADIVCSKSRLLPPSPRPFSCAPLLGDDTDEAKAPPHFLQQRLDEALKKDVAVTTDLRLLVRASMDALRARLGEASWQAAVETVEPVVLAQLRGMVA